ncbi:hypothetical protein ABT160_45865 [Streptomyces sp. NPDC001941]|uniref:hypothetical protein n=1 Tax=Streptomyces sp. NPDC001941 TaxID=3154659 RepID=UPI00332E5679
MAVVEAVTGWVLSRCEALRDGTAGDVSHERLRAGSAPAISHSMEQVAPSASKSLLQELGREKVDVVAVQVFWKALMGLALASDDWRTGHPGVHRVAEDFLDEQG